MGFQAALAQLPLATLSSATMWAFLAALLVPAWRNGIILRFVHPISSNQTYSPALDAFRGLAASMVAIAHCIHFTYPVFDYGRVTPLLLLVGVKAVPMFAALSGYLIYRAVRPIETIEDLRIYVLRRVLRIYPLYLFAVLLVILSGQLIAVDGRFGGTPFAVADILMFKTLGFPIFANPVAWSLYIEVLFYVFLPVFFVTVGRSRMLIASLAVLAGLVVADQVPSREFQLWKFFFFGIIAAELSLRYPAFPSKTCATILFCIGATLLVIDLGGTRTDWMALLGLTRPNQIGFTLALGLALFLIFFALPHLPWLTRLANWFPLRLLGTISYSIFLLHPFYILANFPDLLLSNVGNQTDLWQSQPSMPGWYLPVAFFPGIVAWSIVTYLLIEKPCAEWARRLKVRGDCQIAPV